MKKLLRAFAVILIVGALELLVTLYPLPSALPRLLTNIRLLYTGDEEHSPGSACITQSSCIASHITQNNADTLKGENETLRKQLNFATRTERKPVLAHIIGYSTDPTRSFLIIDKGSRDGIEKGDTVVANDGIMIGTIHSTDIAQSFIVSLNDSRSTILGIITQHDTPIFGVVQGQFNVGLTMGYIPVTADIRKGDLILTSGKQEKIPANLAIGTVEDVQKKSEELFQMAIITPAIDISTLSIVSVLTTKNLK